MFPNSVIGEAGPAVTPWVLAAGSHIAFGVGLFYALKKFFEEVEKSLSEDTKLEIAVRVLDVNPTKSIRSWQSTFLTMFYTVFGREHWTPHCFWRSCLFTVAVTFTMMLAQVLLSPLSNHLFILAIAFLQLFAAGVIGSLWPDYISLWKTRHLMELHRKHTSIKLGIFFIVLDIFITSLLAIVAMGIGMITYSFLADPYNFNLPNAFKLTVELILKFLNLWKKRTVLTYHQLNDIPFIPSWHFTQTISTAWFIPAFFGRLWFLGYVTCGLLLNFSHRLDFGFKWFTRHFDIETRALQSIGVLVGSLTALGYWLLAIIHILP